MKKITTIILSLAAISAVAQDNIKSTPVKSPKTVKTASGLELTVTSKGNGKRPQIGDKVKVHYTGRLTNDTVFDSSVKRGTPFEFKLGAGQVIKGWDEAFQLLDVGDKATIKLPPEIAYGPQAQGKIPANSILIFDIELLGFTEGIRPYDVKGKDTITTKSGLKYMMVTTNKSGQPANGTKATFNYSVFFKDGKPLESSLDRGQPLTQKCGGGPLFAGFDEAVSLLRTGEKAHFIIPAKLAFGDKQQGAIPPNSDLIMDIEVLKVEPIITPVKFDIKGIKKDSTASGLKYYVISKSANPVKAEAGKTVKVHYSGYLADGKMFDSSVERGEPIEFPLGKGQVIPGWDEGIALMHIGDKMRLVIPYHLAYGEQGRPPMIPPKAELTFDVELMDVK
jgi:peptidylprolyl isomerase